MNGLLEKEERIMSLLIEAFDLFQELDYHHQSDKEDFIRSIHDLQKILAMRVVRRDYPEYWSHEIKEEMNETG